MPAMMAVKRFNAFISECVYGRGQWLYKIVFLFDNGFK